MSNSSHIHYFIFEAYYEAGRLKWLYFSIILVLYTATVLSNLLLITVICSNRSLHEPMYLFLCSLFMNELWGSTSLLPFLMLQLFRDVHIIPTSFCFVQIFFVYSYGHIELVTLAVMSYDRYSAICFPLRYHSHMTHLKVFALIVSTWLLLFVAVSFLLSLSAPSKLCGNIIHKVWCDNYSVMKLSCTKIAATNIYGLIHICLLISGPLSVILYTYVHIFKVCFHGSKQTRQKAMSTCVPQLVSIVNFAFGTCFEILQGRFDLRHVPNIGRIFLSVYFLTVQPLLNPVMYGLQISAIRKTCKKTFFTGKRVNL